MGRAQLHWFQSGVGVLGLLADLGREGGVGFGKGVLLAALPAGGWWVTFRFEKEFDGGSCVIHVLHFGAIEVLKAVVEEVAV